jgi:hypothetical protein
MIERAHRQNAKPPTVTYCHRRNGTDGSVAASGHEYLVSVGARLLCHGTNSMACGHSEDLRRHLVLEKQLD